MLNVAGTTYNRRQGAGLWADQFSVTIVSGHRHAAGAVCQHHSTECFTMHRRQAT
jgi:hypothetical protein